MGREGKRRDGWKGEKEDERDERLREESRERGSGRERGERWKGEEI